MEKRKGVKAFKYPDGSQSSFIDNSDQLTRFKARDMKESMQLEQDVFFCLVESSNHVTTDMAV